MLGLGEKVDGDDERIRVLVGDNQDFGGAGEEIDADFAEELALRYADGLTSLGADARAGLEAQAPKRVAIRFKPVRTATWDHRKLGGTY